ncbi:HAMP domain-containing histidine kinase [Paenibacillus tritici]|uniref:HAMP domain-containing sensor histidine kinase n=1 Tax=Paenibacillus tritici TaxID=1873425 RepID=UPI001BADBE48|nr:HAMP domain-containing sensor histidine kinase [Paenibacillus tritici]QUL54875.1 HAMP domain-containing histidine kinase [Paenibacillus tritici]
MPKRLRGFRARLVQLLGVSMLLSGSIIYGLFKLLQLYYAGVRWEDPEAELRRMIFRIGDFNVFLMLFIPLMLIFFFKFTKPYIRYLDEISKGIHHLANGEFQNQVQIASKDEFSAIAEDLNAAGAKLQEAVQRGDFAESSKDQLVVNLAHDLRTPLTSVLGYLDLILKDKQLPIETIRHFATIAFTKSQRLEKLIDGLFEITRMNYGTLPMVKTHLDLSELLRQLNEELYPVFERNGLTSRLQVNQGLSIYGDGDLLVRVLGNLLTNAARYGQEGVYVDINGRLDSGVVAVEVINYGNPIPPEEQPHIFEMYYSGDRARTHQEGGTGLGLFIARNIVEQHEGSLSVESNELWTRFEMRLPQA